MSAPKYAKIVPVLRVLRGRILGIERLRELTATASVDDVLAGLRDTLYGSAAEARIPEKVVQSMYSIYWDTVVKVAKMAPGEASDLALSFIRVDEVSDAISIAYKVARASGVWGSYMTSAIKDSFASRVLAEPEAASSLQRLVEVAPRWMRRILSDGVEAFNSARDPGALAYYRPLARARVFYESLASLDRSSVRRVLDVLCPLLRSEAAAAALEAAVAGIPGRSLEAGWRVRVEDLCGVNWRRLAEVVSREGDPSSVTAYLKQTMPDVSLEGKTPLEQAANARSWGKRESRRRAEVAFLGYPFHAGLIAAGLLLLRLEFEDLKSVLLATKYKMHPSDYAVVLSRPGVA